MAGAFIQDLERIGRADDVIKSSGHLIGPFETIRALKRVVKWVPALRRMENGDWVACHRAEELDLSI